MIALVEGSERQKTPNEIALNILLAGLTIIFLLATVTPAAVRDLRRRRAVGRRARRAARVPDPDDDRRAALGDRHRGHGPPRAAQRARDERPRGRGRGRRATRCCSTRPARSPSATGRPTQFVPVNGVDRAGARRRRAALEPRRRDAGGPVDRRARQGALRDPRARARRARRSSPFTAQTRMSGVDFEGRSIRKGAADSVRRWVEEQGGTVPAELGGRGRRDRRPGRHAARRRGERERRRARQCARRDLPQGHREAGHRRALRRAPRAWASAR